MRDVLGRARRDVRDRTTGMGQLAATGWMHNRVRPLAASLPASVRLGADHPHPVVDLAEARTRTLAAIAAVRVQPGSLATAWAS